MQDGDKFTYEFSNNFPIPTDSTTNIATNDASLDTQQVDQNLNVLNTTLKPGYYYESWFSEYPEERFIIKWMYRYYFNNITCFFTRWGFNNSLLKFKIKT